MSYRMKQTTMKKLLTIALARGSWFDQEEWDILNNMNEMPKLKEGRLGLIELVNDNEK